LIYVYFSNKNNLNLSSFKASDIVSKKNKIAMAKAKGLPNINITKRRLFGSLIPNIKTNEKKTNIMYKPKKFFSKANDFGASFSLV
jgi:hypothetical protein